jgi:hypothetical protein
MVRRCTRDEGEAVTPEITGEVVVMKPTLGLLVACLCSMAAALPAGATASTPANDAYLSTPITVPPTVEGASATSVPHVASVTPPRSTGDTLPFTGLDIGAIAGAAVLLLGLGFALRRGTGSAA